MPFDRSKLPLYPEEPGVYLMKNGAGEILYVGKAKNLKARVKQYFNSQKDGREQIPYLMAQVEAIDTIIALTERDALLLENNLIKKHQPKYNILLKDDKSFITLLLTRHRYPMLRLLRYKGRPKEKGHYFGPYTSAYAARQLLDLLQTLFPLRQCSDAELASRKRPCLLYEMKRCVAPCVKKCSEEEYEGLVGQVVRLLKGGGKEVLEGWRREMERASEALEFERAAEWLRKIALVERMGEVHHVDHPGAKDCDVVGLYREGGAATVALLSFREGKLLTSKSFHFPSWIERDEECLSSFLWQYYGDKRGDFPQEILLPKLPEMAEELEEMVGEVAEKKVPLVVPQKQVWKKEVLEMAHRNAKALFAQEQDKKAIQERLLLELQEALHLTRFPRRIDCLDTSHLGGSDPVASIVSFVDGEKEKGGTRLFKIGKSGPGDDVGAMREVLERHLSREKGRGIFCDLLIVDGGKGQLRAAEGVLKGLEIASVDLIGLTKEEGRHDKGLSAERVFVPGEREPIVLPPRSPLLFLLQRIRDEAHRQTITFHRKRRSKRVIQSALDQLEGIGPVKKRRLLSHFGSVEKLKRATGEELAQVEGINQRDRETIVKWIAASPERA